MVHKTTFMRMISAILLLALASVTNAQSSQKLIVKFKPGIDYQVDYNAKKIIHPKLVSIPILNQLESITSIVNMNLPVDPALKNIELVKDIHFLTLPANANLDAEAARLLNTGLFEYVEKDGIGKGAGVNATTPNDPYFPNYQWSLKNLGTFSGTAVNDADIDMDDAWDITTGDANTIVCLLDAGFKLDHPELSGRIWQNPGEIPGNGIDDDGNGYIDDVQGWDWSNNDNDPTDDLGHGTNVGSIIAAKGNNFTGMSGINWNCKLMVGKVINSADFGFYSWWESGIYYAVSKGAKVINMSVGGSTYSASMQAACDFAMANNVMVVVCMQNQNTSAPYYPAAYSSVIAVGSTSDNDHRTVPFPWDLASGSNYGSHIDLVAPGNYILGADYLSNTAYNYWAGTSQATPEVAGVVSLMLALKPNITFAQVMNVLATTSQDQVGDPAEDTPGWDQYYGWGRLNANAALNAVLALVPLEFGDIIAHRKDDVNEVVWSTYSETDTKKFVVEYSTDRTGWQPIREVTAAGNATSVKNYSIDHFISDKEDAFYRIRAVNNDASYIYSKIVRVNKNISNQAFSIDKIISSTGAINIYTTAAHPVDCMFSLYSMDGKLVYKTQALIQNGSGQFSWKVNLVPGRYQLIAMGEHQKISQGVVVK